jgi:hypothetical protein
MWRVVIRCVGAYGKKREVIVGSWVFVKSVNDEQYYIVIG